MEIKVVMLGTSGSTPTRDRSMPAVAAVYDGGVYLFDCGEGTQMQMLRYGVNAYKVRAIFISHTHADHIIGIAGLVRTLAMERRRDALDIFVPKGCEGAIKSLIGFDKAIIGYEIIVHGISGGIAYRGKGFSVKAFRIDHTIPCLGYVFREDKKRRFIAGRAARLGISGPMHSELQRKGRIRVGRRIVSIGQVTREVAGKSVAYASDTRPSSATAAAAAGVDLLIHESSYSDSEAALAKERKHSTASEAARVAAKAKAKRLVLTHISARYSSAAELEKEARAVFKNSSLAEDGRVIIV